MGLCPDQVLRPGGTAILSAFRVLMTRYNLALPGFRTRANISNPAEHRRWLDRRLQLFLGFCLPSVVHQAMRPDVWLLGFDGDDREIVEPVLEAVKDRPWIVPAWQQRVGESHEPMGDCFSREILARLTNDHSHVILTRLDSDDSLARNFLLYTWQYSATVTARNPDIADFWVSFPFGTDYDERRCWVWMYPGNPFLSRVQTRERFLKKQKFWIPHTKVLEPRHNLFQPITTEPMWLRSFHGGQVGGRTLPRAGRIRLVPTREVLRNFGVKLKYLGELRPASASWSEAARLVARRFAKRLRRSRRF